MTIAICRECGCKLFGKNRMPLLPFFRDKRFHSLAKEGFVPFCASPN